MNGGKPARLLIGVTDRDWKRRIHGPETLGQNQTPPSRVGASRVDRRAKKKDGPMGAGF